jgi:hypothetical protein
MQNEHRIDRRAARVLVTAAIAAAVALVAAPRVGLAAAQGGSQITVTGCIEKDAASSVPIYKLVVPPPNSKIYRLNAPKEIDVAAHVGHTVDVTGVATEREGSRIAELTVTRLTMVRDSCPSGIGQ